MSSDTLRNPFKRGKGLVLSNLILEGKTNKEIEDYYVGMGFDKKYDALNSNYLYQVRSALKKAGLLDAEGFPMKKDVLDPSKPAENLEKAKAEGEERAEKNKDGEEKTKVIPPITRRPDWDLLTPEMINKIDNPELKMNILNYKTEIAKLKQEFKPEFATREQFDSIAGRLGGIEETMNRLITKLDDPEEKNSKKKPEPETEEEEEEEEAINPSVVSTENPLSEQEAVEKPKSRAGESLIEVEKGVIITKLIGFTTKTLMWYELDKTEGLLPNGEAFPGNLADYVNSCVEDVHVSRNIGLSITQRRQVK